MKKSGVKFKEIDISESLKVITSSSGVVVGVSGGKDSVTLLDILCKNIPKDKIYVAHINHGFRKTSDKDERFVKALSKAYGVEFYSKKLTQPSRENLEQFGRTQRYLFFAEIAKKNNAALIATAHTANDVAETILMQLLTNKKLSGISFHDAKRNLIRPLLKVKRTHIDAYADSHRLSWQEDETNTDTQRLRNKVRHVILPFLLQAMGQEILDVLISQGHYFSEYEEAIELLLSLKSKILTEHSFGSKEWLRGLRGILAELPRVLGEKLLEEIFLPKLGFRIGRLHRKRLYNFISGSSLQIELSSGVTVRRKSSGLAVLKC